MISEIRKIGSALLLCWSLLGCVGRTDLPVLGQVDGVIRVNGTPQPGLWIVFEPENGRASTGLTDANGHYELNYLGEIKGAIPGPHKVSISWRGLTGEDADSTSQGNQKLPRNLFIPEQYNLASKLTANVVGGKNTFEFELTIPLNHGSGNAR